MVKKIALTALSLVLVSCSALPEWVGGDEKKDTVVGERISVLKVGATVTPDSSLAATKVDVPGQQQLNKWRKSNGYDGLVPQNIAAPKSFSKKKVVSIGSGGDEISAGAAPVIADGKIFTIDMVGNVTAFDVVNHGKKLWKYEVEVPEGKEDFSSAGILYHNGKIYITAGYNVVIALDATSGAVAWKRTISSIARSAPDAGGDTVFVNTVDNKLYALNANDGAIEWVHAGTTEEISVFGSSSPLAHDDIVFAPYSSGELYALKLKEGSEVWAADLTRSDRSTTFSLADIDASPVIAGDKVYAVSNDGVLSAMDILTGKRLWEQEISGNKTPWVAGGFIYVLNDKNEMICANVETGGVKWVVQLASYKKEESKKGPINWHGPVMAGDLLLVAGSNGQLLSLSPENGSIVSKTKIPDNVNLPPVVAHNNVYLVSDDAKLVILSGNQ